MHSTSSPQSLLSMFSAMSQTQAPPELQDNTNIDGQGFSSILDTFLPESTQLPSAAYKLQSLPLEGQALPPTEDGARVSSLFLDMDKEDLAMDSVLGQLRFGPIGLLAGKNSTDALDSVRKLAAEDTLSELADGIHAIEESEAVSLSLAELEAREMHDAQAFILAQNMMQTQVQEHSLTKADMSAQLAAEYSRLTPQVNIEPELIDLPTGKFTGEEFGFSETLAADSEFYVPNAQSVRLDLSASTQPIALDGMDVASLSVGNATGQASSATTAAAAMQSITTGADTDSIDTSALKEAAQIDNESLQTQLRRERLEFGSDRSAWGGALSSRIVTMIADDIQQARIHLDPPELGSLEIKLQVQQDQATVQVHAQNPQVREVLESHAQRLRDALASQGIQLSEFDVSDRSQQQAGGDQPSEQAHETEEWLVSEEVEQEIAPRATLNLLDTFA